MDKRGLGKGIDALFSDGALAGKATAAVKSDKQSFSSTVVSGRSVVNISLEKIIANQRQPRSYFDQEKLSELSESIKEHGVAEPVIVRAVDGGKFELIAGERRVRASRIAGKTEVPAIIKAFTDEQALEIAIVENIQREDLSALEEADAYRALMKEFGMTQDQVAKKLGKSRSAVANTLRLLELPDNIKESLARAEISAGHARALLSIDDPVSREDTWRQLVENKLSVRDAELLATNSKSSGKVKATPQKSNLPAELNELQELLSSLFSTKVKITGNTEKGKIEIHYFSKEDIERVIDYLVEEE